MQRPQRSRATGADGHRAHLRLNSPKRSRQRASACRATPKAGHIRLHVEFKELLVDLELPSGVTVVSLERQRLDVQHSTSRRDPSSVWRP